MKALSKHLRWMVLMFGVSAGTFVLLSCQNTAQPLNHKTLTHASRQILVDGWSQNKVRAGFGEPKEMRTIDPRALKYGLPKQLPRFDEQWIYYDNGGMKVKLFYFAEGAVVLAVEEWSDF